MATPRGEADTGVRTEPTDAERLRDDALDVRRASAFPGMDNGRPGHFRDPPPPEAVLSPGADAVVCSVTPIVDPPEACTSGLAGNAPLPVNPDSSTGMPPTEAPRLRCFLLDPLGVVETEAGSTSPPSIMERFFQVKDRLRVPREASPPPVASVGSLTDRRRPRGLLRLFREAVSGVWTYSFCK